MNSKREAALKAAGFWVGDSADWLELSDEDRALVDLQATLITETRRRREAIDMSQAALASKIGSSQSRIAKIENGASGTSLDLMIRAYFAVGGTLPELAGVRPPRKSRPASPPAGSTVKQPKAKAPGRKAARSDPPPRVLRPDAESASATRQLPVPDLQHQVFLPNEPPVVRHDHQRRVPARLKGP